MGCIGVVLQDDLENTELQDKIDSPKFPIRALLANKLSSRRLRLNRVSSRGKKKERKKRAKDLRFDTFLQPPCFSRHRPSRLRGQKGPTLGSETMKTLLNPANSRMNEAD